MQGCIVSFIIKNGNIESLDLRLFTCMRKCREGPMSMDRGRECREEIGQIEMSIPECSNH